MAVRTELVKKIAKKFPDLSYEQICLAFDNVFDDIVSSLAKGHRVELRGFGTFSVRLRASRTQKNPLSQSIITMSERNAIYFKLGRALKEFLNS